MKTDKRCDCGCDRYTQVILTSDDCIRFGKYKSERFRSISRSYTSWAIRAGALGPCEYRSSEGVLEHFKAARLCRSTNRFNTRTAPRTKYVDYDYDDSILWDFGLTQ